MPAVEAAPARFAPGIGRTIDFGDVHVWAVEEGGDDQTQLLAVLDADERARAARFRFERHRREFVAAHWLLRRALSYYDGRPPAAWRFASEPGGRPVIAGDSHGRGPLRFSLSHAGGGALVAVTHELAVGVDLEGQASLARINEIAPRILNASECIAWQHDLDRPRAARFALTRWTLKEAYAKARGLGLKLDFTSVGFAETGGFWALAAAPADDLHRTDWRFFTFAPWRDSCAALAVLPRGGDVDWRLIKITL